VVIIKRQGKKHLGRFINMTKDEIINYIEEMLSSFPIRMSGNEINPRVANKLRGLAVSDRPSLLEALRQYLSFRVSPTKRQPEDARPEARLWLALDVSEYLELYELKPDIESLLQDIRNGKTLLPVYENMVARHLQKISANKTGFPPLRE
jgi:hypothetical protein